MQILEKLESIIKASKLNPTCTSTALPTTLEQLEISAKDIASPETNHPNLTTSDDFESIPTFVDESATVITPTVETTTTPAIEVTSTPVAEIIAIPVVETTTTPPKKTTNTPNLPTPSAIEIKQDPSTESVNGGFSTSPLLSSNKPMMEVNQNQKVEEATTTIPTTTLEPNIESKSKPPTQLENNGFLNGLPVAPVESNDKPVMKVNQSQKVDQQEITTAIQTTIPSIVSNIFSNIQNLTIDTEHNHSVLTQTQQTTTLTSIDGDSVNIKGDSSAQIEAQGEKLFLNWLEHQLDSLHLTASMANYIRKSAVNLFSHIIRQYIKRVERLGGNIEQNVQRATQMALNNTQNLISFLLRNYLNMAGGLMQMIGEYVSRVGKQLDSTGETIAHISLNPFDIVSKVFESLPNPTNYANYFREFGKQLIDASQQEQQEQQTTTTRRPHGLLSKTVGALGKTFGSWLG